MTVTRRLLRRFAYFYQIMDRFSCYKVECSHLSFPSFKPYLNHIRNTHSFEPNFQIRCTVSGCFQTFKVFSSFTAHLYRKHQEQISRLNAIGTDDTTLSNAHEDEEREDEYITGAEDPELEEKATRSLFLSTLKMQETHALTDTVTSDFLGHVKDVVGQNVSHLKERVQRCLSAEGTSVTEAEGLQEVFDTPLPMESAFEKFKTVRQRTEYAIGNLNMVEPEEVVLAEEIQYCTINGHGRFKVPRHTFQYISVIDMLQALLNQYDVVTEIEYDHSMTNGKIRDFCDGRFYKNHPLFSSNSSALQIMMYFDEFDVCDPLGSKSSKHKIGAFYWMLGNFHPKYRSVLRSLQLAIICPSRYLGKYGLEKVLHRFMVDINLLESDVGIPFKINGVVRHFNGTIRQCLADNLGSHYLGGFMEGFNAYRRCRFCMGTPEEIQQKFTEEEFVLRSRRGHDHHLAQIEEDPSCTSVYGVKQKSPLNKSSYFHVVDGLPSDIMHDLFEGVIPRHLKLLLQFFIVEMGFFTLKMLNDKIKTFDYGVVEISNKPSSITNSTLNSSDDSLKQSAAQMWCLARYFPLMISEWVPSDNVHLLHFCDLLHIVDLCCAPVTSPGAGAYLRILIRDYLQEMVLLYPTKNITPKQHFLIHYPRQLVQVGPLVRLWCMRFEAKNHYFKNLVRSSQGFQNVCKTLALRHQRLQCYWLSVEGGCLRSAQENGPGRSVAINEMTRGRKDLFLRQYPNLLPETQLYRANWIQCFGTKYQAKQILVTGHDGLLPQFLQIKETYILPNGDVVFVGHKLHTVRHIAHLSAYEILIFNEEGISNYDALIDHHPLLLHKVKVAGIETLVVRMRYDLTDADS